MAFDLVQRTDFGPSHWGVNVAHSPVGRLDGISYLLLEVLNVTYVTVDQQLLRFRMAIVCVCTQAIFVSWLPWSPLGLA